MVSAKAWARTKVGAHSEYSCAWCRRRVSGPHEFYVHLEREHPIRARRARDEAMERP